MDQTQRRRPTIANEWQLVVLKRLQSESSNPTEEQRLAAAAETGLDEKWVRNWFTRQRSKVAARNRKDHSMTSRPRQRRVPSAVVPTFKLQLCRPTVPNGPQQGLSFRKSPPMPIDTLTASLESRSSCPSRTILNAEVTPHSHQSVSAPTYLNNPSQKSTFFPQTTTIPTYSRDPLFNRYPDFSQFFCPQVHERFRSSELLAPVNNHSHLTRLLVNPDDDLRAPMYLQALLDPLHPGSLPAHQSPSPYLRSCPVAFSMRLEDLVDHP